MFSESSTGRWAVLQLTCCPRNQGKLSENILQNLFHNPTPLPAQHESVRRPDELRFLARETQLSLSLSLSPAPSCVTCIRTPNKLPRVSPDIQTYGQCNPTLLHDYPQRILAPSRPQSRSSSCQQKSFVASSSRKRRGRGDRGNECACGRLAARLFSVGQQIRGRALGLGAWRRRRREQRPAFSLYQVSFDRRSSRVKPSGVRYIK